MPIYKQPWLWIIVFSIMVSVAIFYSAGDGIFSIDQEDDFLIVVNEETMNEKEFNMVLEQSRQNFLQMAQMSGENGEASEEEMKAMAVDTAVDQLLLMSYAKEIGLTTTESETNDLYEEIIALEPEAKTKADLFDVWQEEGFGQEEMEKQIEIYLMYDKMYEKYSKNITVEEEYLKEAYDEYVGWMREMGDTEEEIEEYEEIKDDLRDLIHQQKALEKMEEDLQEFRKESSIETFI